MYKKRGAVVEPQGSFRPVFIFGVQGPVVSPADVVLLSGPYALGGLHRRIVLPVDVVLLSGPYPLGGFLERYGCGQARS